MLRAASYLTLLKTSSLSYRRDAHVLLQQGHAHAPQASLPWASASSQSPHSSSSATTPTAIERKKDRRTESSLELTCYGVFVFFSLSRKYAFVFEALTALTAGIVTTNSQSIPGGGWTRTNSGIIIFPQRHKDIRRFAHVHSWYKVTFELLEMLIYIFLTCARACVRACACVCVRACARVCVCLFVCVRVICQTQQWANTNLNNR